MVATLFRHFEVMMMVFTPFVVKTEMKHPVLWPSRRLLPDTFKKIPFLYVMQDASQIEMDGNPTDRATSYFADGKR